MALKGQAAEEVGRAYRRAHELCQQTGETRQLFPVLWGLWHFHAVREELPPARALGEQLLSLAQRVQDPTQILGAHFMLGGACLFAGEFASAHAHFAQSIALYDPQQHHAHAFLLGPDPAVFCRAFDAHALWHLGYPDQARASIEGGLAQAQSTGGKRRSIASRGICCRRRHGQQKNASGSPSALPVANTPNPWSCGRL